MTASRKILDPANLCWSETGIWGNRSCPDLATIGSCMQCDVYRQAGHTLLARELPAEYRAEWSRILARPVTEDTATRAPFFVFRIGASWLALAVAYLVEVSRPVAIRSVPNRRSEALLGLTAVRGEIVPCVSVHVMLGEQPADPARFVVVRFREGKWAFPADEVLGVQELAEAELQPLPANLAQAETVYTKGMLACRDVQVGLLDEEMLFGAIERRIA